MADFGPVVDKFVQCRNELMVRITGGRYIIPGTQDFVEYHGIDYTKEMKVVLEQCVDPKMSHVALRTAELYLTCVQEVRISATVVKVELKSVLDNKELVRDSRMGAMYSELKSIYDKVLGYCEVCQQQYDYMVEVLYGVSQVNIAINKRHFNGSDMMYDYKRQ